MNVLIIPEDCTHDQYILKPIIEGILRELKKAQANVRVLRDPNLGGVERALKSEELSRILDRNKGMYQLILLLVDRDGKVGRRNQLVALERQFGPTLPAKCCFLAEVAIEEIEVWASAGVDLLDGWRMEEVRKLHNPKEDYFSLLAKHLAVATGQSGGRRHMGKEAGKNIDRVLTRCPELKHLSSRISDFLKTGTITSEPYNG